MSVVFEVKLKHGISVIVTYFSSLWLKNEHVPILSILHCISTDTLVHITNPQQLSNYQFLMQTLPFESHKTNAQCSLKKFTPTCILQTQSNTTLY